MSVHFLYTGFFFPSFLSSFSPVLFFIFCYLFVVVIVFSIPFLNIIILPSRVRLFISFSSFLTCLYYATPFLVADFSLLLILSYPFIPYSITSHFPAIPTLLYSFLHYPPLLHLTPQYSSRSCSAIPSEPSPSASFHCLGVCGGRGRRFLLSRSAGSMR